MNAHEQSFQSPTSTLDSRVERVFLAIGVSLRAERIVVVRIDGWFGDKWLGFSGKLLGALGVRALVGKRDRLSPPAFHPNRVRSSSAFERRDEAWIPVNAPLIHDVRTSETNERLRIADMVGAGTLVCWIGSDPDGTRRGCLMMCWIGEQTDDAVWARVDSGAEHLQITSSAEPSGGLLGILLLRAAESSVE